MPTKRKKWSKKKSKKRKQTRKKKVKTKNIYNKTLQVCSSYPLTGYFRDGYCRTDESDHGTHTVCAKVTDDFLDYTKRKGNDLSTKRGSFPGLHHGDNWCLCSLRWKEMYDKDPRFAPKIRLNATHKKTLDYINKDILKRYGY